MTRTQIAQANNHYWDLFGDHFEQWVIDLLAPVQTVEDLYEIEDQLSAGQFDCAEAILEDRS